MSRAKSRTCKSCGIIEITASKSPICISCYVKETKVEKIKQEILTLEQRGYIVHDNFVGSYDKRIYKLTNPNCNHTFESRYDNLNSLWKRTQKISCGVCGQHENMKKTLDRYIKKYGKTNNDSSIWENYQAQVRKQSNKNYKKYKALINPENEKRGLKDYHLDHKVPIAICFRFNVPVENAASVENLCMLYHANNLKKSWFGFDPLLLIQLGGQLTENDLEYYIAKLMLLLKQQNLSVKLRAKNLIINDTFKVNIVSNDLSLSIKNCFKSEEVNIREYELKFNYDRSVNKILHKLKLSNKTKVFARKCIVKQIDTKTSKDFCKTHHFQGNVGASIKLGLFYNDLLVAVMTFGKPRFNKNYELELLRFCVHQEFQISGAASKLFSSFIKSFEFSSIISYADARWSKGDVYDQLGFSYKGVSSSFYYYDKINNKILSRYELQKHKVKELLKDDFDDNLTNNENLAKLSIFKINEPGQLVFEYKKS